MKLMCVAILVAVVVVFYVHGGDAVDVSVGRQMFVDDLLVESVDGVVRYWNHPTKIDHPFVWPESGAAPKTVDGSSGAMPGEVVNLTCATDGDWHSSARRKHDGIPSLAANPTLETEKSGAANAKTVTSTSSISLALYGARGSSAAPGG